ncbi:hypothetical protein D3C84_991110 [compost metagenome]
MRRRGNDQEAVAVLAVVGQAVNGVGVDQRFYFPVYECIDCHGDLLRGATGHRGKREVHVLFHGQSALRVEGHQLILLADE